MRVEEHDWTISMSGARTICDVACVNGKCVITGDGFCGHPRGGALQRHHQLDPNVLRRWNAARAHLAREMAGQTHALNTIAE
jgi:hypothetical protein